MSEITFIGHRISKDGLQTDAEKVRTIKEMPPPQNVTELRRFLGLSNYLSKFSPNLTEITTPLRILTRKDVPWTWSETQQDAFNHDKLLVTQAPVLAMYDPQKELTLENDASEHGLGSTLMQNGQLLAYASCSLKDTERKWAQIEIELLALIFGLEKFEHYTYGRHVNIVTDHQTASVNSDQISFQSS